MELKLNKQEAKEFNEVKMLMKNIELFRKPSKYQEKRFILVGQIGELKEPPAAKYKCAIELKIPDTKEFIVAVNFEFLEFSNKPKDFVQLTELRLDIIEVKDRFEIQIFDTMQTKCILLTPLPNLKIVKKSEFQLSTPNSRRRSQYSLDPHELSDPLWPNLMINLSYYSKNTEFGLRYELDSLLSIQDLVSFFGIITAIELKKELKGTSFKFNIRDRMTNDAMDTYVYTTSENRNALDYLSSFSQYDVVHVIAKRRISQYLNIYCKLILQQDFSNFTLESKHNECSDKNCPCKFGSCEEFTPNFSPFSLIFLIKPVVLFRLFVKLQLRVMYLNYLVINYKCSSCKSVWKMKENFCCQNQKLKTNIMAKIIAEDSSGVADCEVPTLKNVSALLNINKLHLRSLTNNKTTEQIIKYSNFPEPLKIHLKTMGPIFKHCLTKITPKHFESENNPSPNLVQLNTSNSNTDICLKVLKVYN